MQLWQKGERQSYKLHLIFQADLQTVTVAGSRLFYVWIDCNYLLLADFITIFISFFKL